MNSQKILMLVTAKNLAEKNAARLRELGHVIHAGTPGFSGFDDQWGRKLECPSYGQN